MRLVVYASVRLHNALRIASVIVPLIAVVVVVASGGHAQPDFGKWR